MRTRRCVGYSTTEVLICLALVGLLTVIAVPGFQRHRSAAQFAMTRSDMQTIILGLEAYKLGEGVYPWMNSFSSALSPVESSSPPNKTLERLTTPIAYVTDSSVFYDAFEGERAYEGADLESVRELPEGYPVDYFKQYFYHARNTRDTATWGQFDDDPVWYLLESTGPDKYHHYMWQPLNGMTSDTESNRAFLGKTIYDPTNGSMSRGSLWEVGGAPEGTGTSMATLVNGANSSHISGWERYGD